MKPDAKIKQIISSWFYTEPLLFSVACTHSIVQNQGINVAMRSGKKRIEFNPEICGKESDEVLENQLKFEIYRILLGHPYARKPFNAQKKVLLLASDVAIYQYFKPEIPVAGVEYLESLSNRFHTLINPLGEKWAGTEEEKFFMRNLNLNRNTKKLEPVDKLSFEQWYKRLVFLISQLSVKGENAGNSQGSENFSNQAEEETELWEENPEIMEEMASAVEKAEAEEGWGGTGGELQRLLCDTVDFSFDYRRALTQFRQNIVSANRKLTRMRPSRRYGFQAMGSRYERKANILIAVDVSGSITDESFEHFTHAIKNFFFLGIIEKIDLIFFDVDLKNKTPVPFKKKIELSQIKGRGGTNFLPVLDFFAAKKSDYSGMIIFTDGEGDIPDMKTSGGQNILWILDSRLSFEKQRQLITCNGAKCTYLPF